jgi:cytochrome bd-type quinol oxidase subunit 1
MSTVDPALLLLAFTMFPHILGASLVLGFAWFTFAFEFIGRRRNDRVYVESSKAISKGIVLIYATIGSLGTAITVELFVLWPGFMKTLGVLLWWPFAFAAAMIVSNFLLIAIYWYTFDKIRASLHLLVGFFMALTASLIPLNFRTVMAFTDQPIGLSDDGVQIVLLYANPTLPPLYAHTVFASLSTAGFVICAATALARYIGRGDAGVDAKLFGNGATMGVLFLVPQALAGAWYAWVLGANVPQMFAAITGLFTQFAGSFNPQSQLPHLFATKLLIVGYLLLVGIWLRSKGAQQVLSKLGVAVAITAGLFSSAVIMMGETMQEFSHLPYFVIGQFTIQQFLTSTFPLSVATVTMLMICFVVFITVLFVVLYVAYIKK